MSLSVITVLSIYSQDENLYEVKSVADMFAEFE